MAKANILIRPPSRPSNGAITIRESLGDSARLSRRDPVPRQYRHVINWGNPNSVQVNNAQLYNNPEAVARAIDKLASFEALKAAGVSIPDFTTTAPEVSGSAIWFARTNLRGSSGSGIVAIRSRDRVPNAPLYVRYIRKQREFRVHVVNGKAIFTQEKKRRSGEDRTADQQLIRSYDNGWVFTLTTEETVPSSVTEEAVKAVAAMGLDFGAVDIVLGRTDSKPYVLEINTAPGLQSPTLIAAYVDAFKELLNDRDN